MKKLILSIAIIVMLIGSNIHAQDFVVQVGASKYTAAEIRETIQKNNYPLPEIAIRKLAQDEVLKSLKKDKPSLYKGFFNSDTSKDEILANAMDMPQKQRQALTRKLMFDKWLDQKASAVPVKYLDIKGFWEIVKETAAYKVRAESGMKLDYTRIPYTFAELQVPEGKVLAQKGNTPYLESNEYNEYIAANYPNIEAFAKRSKSLKDVREQLVKLIAGQKITADQFDLKQASLDDIKIDRLVGSYVDAHVYDDEPSLSGNTSENFSDMYGALYKQYESRNQKELAALREYLKGEPVVGTHPFKIKNLVRKAKIEAFKSKIAGKFTSEMTYQWMVQKKFPGKMREAQFVMANEEYEKSVEKAFTDNDITFNAISE